MVNCPECGKPLIKEGHDSTYYCENKSCPVIFVRWPYESSKTRIAYTSFARNR